MIALNRPAQVHSLPDEMKAVRIHRFGGPAVLQLDTIARPVPRKNEVLVEVDVAAVNPVDTKIRTGIYKPFRPELPAILGRDIAGIVVAVGPGGKGRQPFKIGETVFGMIDYRRGAYARYALATADELARRPAGVSSAEASSLGVAAMTARQGLFDHGKLKRGERVLIHGGAGGVGHFAVQFAKVRGAFVVATAGSRDLAWVTSLGADQVIDYHTQVFENVVGNIDLVFDLIAGETQDRSWQVLKESGGRMVSTLRNPDPVAAKRHRATGMRMVVQADNKQLAEIARLVATKKVRVHIARVFPLAMARAAHEFMERGHFRGKVVLTVK